jgi:glycerate 2-kinase
MPLTVLIAPTSLKEALTAREAAEAIAAGIARASPDAHIIECPIIDGGEGFVRAMVDATGGSVQRAIVTGALGEPISAEIALLGGAAIPTAAVEIASAAGLSRIPRDRRNPAQTTSFGVGELIRAALDLGAQRILIGCGDSGVNDAGVGMAQALGVRFLDHMEDDVGFGGGELAKIARIDVSGRDARLGSVRIDAAVNWHNVLLGANGVTRVYGHQKGASPKQIAELESGVANFATRVWEATGADVSTGPGMGASGGMGASIAALLGGVLHCRYELLMPYCRFDELLPRADLVVTAEGKLDAQTLLGKVPAEVARRARARGVPVVALAGTIDNEGGALFAHGIESFSSILDQPCDLADAISRSAALLGSEAELMMRAIRVGQGIGERRLRCACVAS